MLYQNRRSTYASFILLFVVIKIALNLLAISHFGFHRDEFLHLVLADHLDWGYKEVPPFIALLAKISITVFGNSVFAARIFPTIFGGLIVFLTGLIVVELGGKRFAITLACLALIISPGFAASDYLFQPVVFDQFWWVLTAWLLVRYSNTSSVKYLYFFGAAVGIGILTKYSMLFFTLALLSGMLISKQRKLLLNRHFLGAALVALLVWLPNIIWQFHHHLPVFTHMSTLQKEQLDYLHPSDYVKQELLVNGIALFLWLTGLIFLLFSTRLHKFQFLGFAFLVIFLFLLAMHGKPYYLFGAFPMLFAAGGFGFERWLKSSGVVLRSVVVMLFTLPNLILLPLALPLFPLNTTVAIFKALHFAPTWEDQKPHPLSQDYADMLGWDEMAADVAKVWNSLTPEQQKQTEVFADNYGEAGALHHYRTQYGFPDVISLNSSFTLWAPDDFNCKYLIYVDDQGGGNAYSFEKWKWVDSCKKMYEVQTPLAREKGTAVFLITGIHKELHDRYTKELARKRLE